MILITGGAGYIGSHTLIELIDAGYEVLVLDNFTNSSNESIARAEAIVSRPILCIEGDINDRSLLSKVFRQYDIVAVMHFAGYKAVGESVREPLMYYMNNFSGTVTLCEEMGHAGIKKLVFSSSATVYGDPSSVPISEGFPVGGTTNPYGTSKYMVERFLADLCVADPEWQISVLRYFNPVGAHVSGKIGEDPNGIPNNLVPYIAQVAVGKLKCLSVYGNDYDTPDGTGVRDYIHVVDLAKGHIAALEHVQTGLDVINLGTGNGVSVLEMIKTFEQVSGKTVPYKIVARRPGDIAQCYADPSYAYARIKWRAELTLEDMLQDTWRWQSQNPDGYAD